jgi:hypothetical protein
MNCDCTQVIMCRKIRSRLMQVGVLLTVCTGDGKLEIIVSFVVMVDVVQIKVWSVRNVHPCLLKDMNSIETNRLANWMLTIELVYL